MRLHATRLIMALILFSSSTAFTQTAGTVTFKVRTEPFGGKYSPKNIGAVWVENAQGQFVKTLTVWAKKRIAHLIKWQAASGGNTVDAVTSATVRSHQTHTATWNCTDVNGTVVPDGAYKIFVEFTEDNSSKAGKPPGKWTVLEFTKGGSSQTLTPADETYFKDMELVYTPEGAVPSPASLQGKVTDATSGSPIANATVQLKASTVIRYEIKSDGSGVYRFDTVDAGTYELVASRTGYATWTGTITLNAGDQVTGKDIALSPASDTSPPAPPKNVRVQNSN